MGPYWYLSWPHAVNTSSTVNALPVCTLRPGSACLLLSEIAVRVEGPWQCPDTQFIFMEAAFLNFPSTWLREKSLIRISALPSVKAL